MLVWTKRVGLYFLLMCLLTGCHPAPPPDLHEGFTARVTVSYDGGEAVCVLRRTTAGTAALTVEQPAMLAGLTFAWEEGNVRVSYRGLETTLAADNMPRAAFAGVLVRCLDAASAPDALTVTARQGDEVTCVGQGEDGPFTLVYDTRAGRPVRLEIPAWGISAAFGPSDA